MEALHVSEPSCGPRIAGELPTTSFQVNAAGWGLLLGLLVLQYCLFRQSALDNVVWAYPTRCDQTVYLTQAYDTYEQIKQGGLWSGLKYGLRVPNESGMLIHLEASFLFLFLGPSRLTALTVHFLHFALLQVVLVWALRSLGKRWAIAFLGLGLLLSASAPFYAVGGIMDFRIDFMALCLFGTFACLLARTEMFVHRKWSLAVGALGAWCVLARFPTALYVSGILLLLFSVSFLRWVVQRNRPPALAGARLWNCALAGLTCLLLILPGIYRHRGGIYRHYIDHVKGPENEMRFEEFGIRTTADRLLYYPRSILNDHVGEVGYWLAAVVLGAACLLGLLRWATRTAPAAPLATGWRSSLFCAALCALWPVLVLTAYPSPSPVVASVVVVPLVLCAVMVVVLLSGSRQPSLPTFTRHGLLALSGLALSVGLFEQASELTRRSSISQVREDVEELNALYDFVFEHSKQNHWATPDVFIDVLADHLHVGIIKPYVYERHGACLAPRSAVSLDPMLELDERAALACIQKSDLIILTTQESAAAPAVYPFNQALAKVRPQLIAHCERELLPLRTFRFFGGEATVYARPALAVKGHDRDGWLTSAGATLQCSTDTLRKWPSIELRGPNLGATLMGRLPVVTAELHVPHERAPRPVRATLVGDAGEYRLSLRAPQNLPPGEMAIIRLSFDRFFVCKELSLGSDTRKLVMKAPTVQTFQRLERASSRP